MSVRFPYVPLEVDSPETPVIRYDAFRTLVAVRRHMSPKCVAIDSTTKQIYVTEGLYRNARVLIFSEVGQLLNTFSHEDMKFPCGIAVHQDNLYVTDMFTHSLLRFSVASYLVANLVASRGGKGSEIGQFQDPNQLAVSTNGDVFVSDCCNNRIQILDSDLHYQRHISHPTMTHPCDVKLTPEEVFVLCPQSSPCVHVFSHSGEKIRSVIRRGFINSRPSSFCLDANLNLVICDLRDHQINIFSNDWTLLHTLGNRGGEMESFSRPQGVAFTCDLKLIVVSENWKYGLQIFSF